MKTLTLLLFTLGAFAQFSNRPLMQLGEVFTPEVFADGENFQGCSVAEPEKKRRSKSRWIVDAKFIPGVGRVSYQNLDRNEYDDQVKDGFISEMVAIKSPAEREAFIKEQCANMSFEQKARMMRTLFDEFGRAYDSSKSFDSQGIDYNGMFGVMDQRLNGGKTQLRSAICVHSANAVAYVGTHCGVESNIESYLTAGNISLDRDDFIDWEKYYEDKENAGANASSIDPDDYFRQQLYDDTLAQAKSRDSVSSGHAAVRINIKEPGTNEMYQVNWSKLTKVTGDHAGLNLYMNGAGLTNTGLMNSVFTADGKLQGHIRTNLGVLTDRAFDKDIGFITALPHNYMETSISHQKNWSQTKVKGVFAQSPEDKYSAVSVMYSEDTSGEKDTASYMIGVLYFNRVEEKILDSYEPLEQKGFALTSTFNYMRHFRLVKEKKNNFTMSAGGRVDVELTEMKSTDEFNDDWAFASNNRVTPTLSLSHQNSKNKISSRVSFGMESAYFRSNDLTGSDDIKFYFGLNNKLLSAEVNKQLDDGKNLGLRFRSIQNFNKTTNNYLLSLAKKSTVMNAGVTNIRIMGDSAQTFVSVGTEHGFKIKRMPAIASGQIQKGLGNDLFLVNMGLKMFMQNNKEKKK